MSPGPFDMRGERHFGVEFFARVADEEQAAVELRRTDPESQCLAIAFDRFVDSSRVGECVTPIGVCEGQRGREFNRPFEKLQRPPNAMLAHVRSAEVRANEWIPRTSLVRQ